MEETQFITYIEKNYINSINNNKPTNINIDGIVIDITRILKESAELAYGYGIGKTKENIEYLKKISVQNKKDNYLQIIKNNIINIINNITSVNSIKYIIIINEGILPVSFLKYKRNNVYLNWKKNIDIKNFDINNLNVETKLMNDIDQFINEWLIDYIKDKSNLKVYYSPSTKNGKINEKILNLINDRILINKNDVLMIYNNDIETILTTLLINNDNVYIMINEKKIINISMLIKLIKDKYKNNKDDVINDFVFLTGLVNTKIYPNNPIFKDMLNGLYIVFNNYKKFNNTIIKQGQINIKAFYQFLKILSNEESNILKSIALETHNNTYNEIYKAIEIEEYIVKSKVNRKSEFNYNKFKKIWYNKLTKDINNLNNICLNYLNGIGWYYNYIKYGLDYIDDKYYYMYENMPLISDIYEYIINNDMEIYPMSESLNNEKINVLDYKYLILPIYLNNELNSQLKELDKTILGSYRPTDFNILELNNNNIIVEIPIVNPYIVKSITKKINYIEKEDMLYISPIYTKKLENTIDISKILSSL